MRRALFTALVWAAFAGGLALGQLGTPTNIHASTQSADQSTFTTGSFSITGNTLVVVCAGNFESGSPSDWTNALTNTHAGSFSWTQVTDNWSDAGVRKGRMSIFYAVAPASPGNGTMTVTATGDTPEEWTISVNEITGFDTGSPVAANITGNGTGTSPVITLGGTPATTSMVYGCQVNQDTDEGVGSSPGTGFTEITDQETGNSNLDINGADQYDLDSADTTIDWTLNGSNTYWAAGAIEISEASAGAGESRVTRPGLVSAGDGTSYIATGVNR